MELSFFDNEVLGEGNTVFCSFLNADGFDVRDHAGGAVRAKTLWDYGRGLKGASALRGTAAP